MLEWLKSQNSRHQRCFSTKVCILDAVWVVSEQPPSAVFLNRRILLCGKSFVSEQPPSAVFLNQNVPG